MRHEITLKYTRHVIFEIDDDDVYNAYRRAVIKLTEGDTPDDEDLAEYELETATTDDHAIDVRFDIDLDGPTDAHGLHPWRATLRDHSTYQKISDGYDLAPLLRAAFGDIEEEQ